jgi:rare lipoprotein A
MIGSILRPLVLAAALACCLPRPAAAIEGMASWYGAESGRQTASGERFDPQGATCAMRSYRRGERRSVRVTVIATGKSAVCRVNDFGPAKWTGRIIDVSHGIARELGFAGAGVARVSVQ